MMESLTKSTLTKGQIETLVNKHFDNGLMDYVELTDGYYNCSYKVTLEDGKEAVLKVAPPIEAKVLTYEQDIMASEVEFYQLVEAQTEVVIPHIYGYDPSGTLIESPYYFMSVIKGITLNKVGKIDKDLRKNIYTMLAKDLAQLHNIKGESFGYRTMSKACEGKDALGALMVSVEAIYNDGVNNDDVLPYDYDDIMAMYRRCQPAFDSIKEPCFVHFDLWDGNIFVTEEEGIHYEGLIDFERGFYGDPAADFAQIQGYIDIGEAPWFIEIYNRHADNKVQYDQGMRVRIKAYQFYLYLIMFVESDYRDVDGSFQEQKRRVSQEIIALRAAFEKEISNFKEEVMK